MNEGQRHIRRASKTLCHLPPGLKNIGGIFASLVLLCVVFLDFLFWTWNWAEFQALLCRWRLWSPSSFSFVFLSGFQERGGRRENALQRWEAAAGKKEWRESHWRHSPPHSLSLSSPKASRGKADVYVLWVGLPNRAGLIVFSPVKTPLPGLWAAAASLWSHSLPHLQRSLPLSLSYQPAHFYLAPPIEGGKRWAWLSRSILDVRIMSTAFVRSNPGIKRCFHPFFVLCAAAIEIEIPIFPNVVFKGCTFGLVRRSESVGGGVPGSLGTHINPNTHGFLRLTLLLNIRTAETVRAHHSWLNSVCNTLLVNTQKTKYLVIKKS